MAAGRRVVRSTSNGRWFERVPPWVVQVGLFVAAFGVVLVLTLGLTWLLLSVGGRVGF